MGDTRYRLLQSVFAIFWHCDIRGLDNVPKSGPAVFVSNHLGSYGPIAVLTSFPMRLYPWVEHDVTERKSCPAYLRHDFIEPELRLRPPLSRAAAWMISQACVLLMRFLRAVPVYAGSMKMATTWKRSMELLKRNKCLVVFPESATVRLNDFMNAFENGFVGLARLYHRATGQALPLYPLAINKNARAIKVGRPLAFNPRNAPAFEEERIRSRLENSISSLYSSLG